MKYETIRIGLAQINPTVGDLSGNKKIIIENLLKCKSFGCDFAVFPELALTGYPPEDLLLRRAFIQDQLDAFRDIIAQTQDIVCVLGIVDRYQNDLFNAAAVMQDKSIRAMYHKIHLPNYSVFDEERYFEAGTKPLIVDYDGIKIGVSICEDIWIAKSVIECQAFCGAAEIMLNISASPYYRGKYNERFNLIKTKAVQTLSEIIYLNLTGGQDELVFDGRSLVFDCTGSVQTAGPAFEPGLIILDINVKEIRTQRRSSSEFFLNHKNFQNPFKGIETVKLDRIKSSQNITFPYFPPPALGEEEEIYHALILGLCDYVTKNGFTKVTFGLSGGIDSALVAAIAADALGPQNVFAVSMPSQYSSAGSVTDAEKLAENLGIKMYKYAIKDIFGKYLDIFKETFKDYPMDVTEENLQARIRGNLLMALSNKFKWLVLATGNKSEVSVGYCTLYGDTAGGFAPLKDVYKTMVYRLSEYRNQKAGFDLIPRAIIEKAPSAELRPNQTDQDSLPPYDVLDAVLNEYIEKQKSVQEITVDGHDLKTVRKIIRLVDVNEYKRRQAAPGVKITRLAFGKDRRLPITNKYRQ
ncbi:NAD+ synthase [candidate division KSB1 bacterium]|nr:NAD+ synthase [candidate division KSB1 bacterium]